MRPLWSPRWQIPWAANSLQAPPVRLASTLFGKGCWPAYKGKVKGRQKASPKLGLGRFAKLFRQRRLRCALDSLPFQSSSEMRGIAQAERSSPGAVSSSSGVLSDNSLPLGSDHANSVAPPGITQEGGSQLISVRTFGHIEDLRAPIQVMHGRSSRLFRNCPRHSAPDSAEDNSRWRVSSRDSTLSEDLHTMHVQQVAPVQSFPEQHNAVPSAVSVASLDLPSQGSNMVPPPPPPMSCARHRGGTGWSMLDPCEVCIQIAMEADLGFSVNSASAGL